MRNPIWTMTRSATHAGPSEKQGALMASIVKPDDVFRLRGSVGDGGDNRPEDVAKTQLLLNGLGYQDLRRTNGPTGNLTIALDDGIRRFQKDLGLRIDGRIQPIGETMSTIRTQVADFGSNHDSKKGQETTSEKPEKQADQQKPKNPTDREKEDAEDVPWWEDLFNWVTRKVYEINPPKDDPGHGGGGIRG